MSLVWEKVPFVLEPGFIDLKVGLNDLEMICIALEIAFIHFVLGAIALEIDLNEAEEKYNDLGIDFVCLGIVRISLAMGFIDLDIDFKELYVNVNGVGTIFHRFCI